MIELKNPGDENATQRRSVQPAADVQAQIGSLFRANAVLVISDGMQAHRLAHRHAFITTHAEIGTPIQVLMATAYATQSFSGMGDQRHIGQRSMEKAAEKFEQRKQELLAEARVKAASEKRSDAGSKQVN